MARTCGDPHPDAIRSIQCDEIRRRRFDAEERIRRSAAKSRGRPAADGIALHIEPLIDADGWDRIIVAERPSSRQPSSR